MHVYTCVCVCLYVLYRKVGTGRMKIQDRPEFVYMHACIYVCVYMYYMAKWVHEA